MAVTYITSKQLILELNITSEKLIEIENHFDAIPDDEWELKINIDYRVVSGNGLREYTQSGAYTIARYLEATEKLSFWQKVFDWFTQTRKKIRQSFIRKKILDNCSSLVRRRDTFWISRSDAVAIFGTRSDYLQKMEEYTKKFDQPLIKGQDYDDFGNEGDRYFSMSGFLKLSRAFSGSLQKKNRQEECLDVGEVIVPQIEDIVKRIIDREKAINKAKSDAKKRDNKTCQVTAVKVNRVETQQLAAHHLYSRSTYPHLADCIDNLITITVEVHNQFHDHYMGGKGKPSMPEDFIQFVQQYYPDNFGVVTWLENQKLKLGHQDPVDTRKPHVLYLPAARVQ
ncbi:hypothetical protein VB780_02235 [Leptolyngbya sp. CCNP1308]|uniref:hypothetical protein n=1 Tax=Leptolyngbya sp. CCNP1308 TaxID=3110255 RepID=UPI002B203D0B|nr:hypothetical protein [Leptolyngbya sp. CCNP1308]MEA5447370.1 hypothetical protein [Leptolyngbya sp. CCNP1308]